MSIDNYLQNYRDYLYTKESLLDLIDRSSSASDIYVTVKQTTQLLNELLETSEFLGENLFEIETEIQEIFDKVHLKLDKLEAIAEGYQVLNVNELQNQSVSELKVYPIKNYTSYNEFLGGLALPNVEDSLKLQPSRYEKTDKGAVSYYSVKDLTGSLVLPKVSNPHTAILRNAKVFNIRGEVESVVQQEKPILLSDSADTVSIEIEKEAGTRDIQSFLYVLKPVYQPMVSLVLAEQEYKKEGNRFKLGIESDVPYNTHVIIKIIFKYKNINNRQFEQTSIFVNLGPNKNIIVDKDQIESLNIPFNALDTVDYEGNLIHTEPVNTHPDRIVYKGNNVFDITKLPAREFSTLITLDLYSLSDINSTPIIKGMYGYVTEQL